MDGLIVNGLFIPGRTCNAQYGTQSPDKLKKIHPTWDIEPHYDIGKHLYWKPIDKNGTKKAVKLGLMENEYPKPGLAHEMVPKVSES